MDFQFPEHKRDPQNLEFPVWICGCNRIPRDRDSPWNKKTVLFTWMSPPLPRQRVHSQEPPGVDIAWVPLQIWMFLYSSLSLGFLWPAYSHEVQPPRWNSMVREGVQQQVISWGNKGTKYKLSEKTCLCWEAGTVSGLLQTHIQTGNSRFHGFLLYSGNWKSISLSMWS